MAENRSSGGGATATASSTTRMSYAAAVTQSHSKNIVSQSTSISVQKEAYMDENGDGTCTNEDNEEIYYIDDDDEEEGGEGEEGELVASWYSTGCNEDEYKRFEAAEVRRQVRQAPPFEGQTKGYPKEYHNDPPLPLKAEPEWTEYPIVPTPGGNYRRGRPGPVRAFYNDSDRENFDLAYHDDSRPPIGPREGRDYKRSPFSLARYHPGSGSGQQKKSKSS